jgi:glycerol-3-phosphate dehydrogenase
MATSDGRILFFLPWLNHTIVGTTDSPSSISKFPAPKEDEIQWILNEVSKYLSIDLKVRRSDVLSAWTGIRPLVADPDSSNTAAISRDHTCFANLESGTVTICGK